MALKRKSKVIESFSLASMTDIIFLLLIFFMVTSTFIIPNAVDVDLPSTSKINNKDIPPIKITLTKNNEIFIGRDDNLVKMESLGDIYDMLQSYNTDESDKEAPVALYADQDVSYRDIMSVIDQIVKADKKLILVTNPQ